jgi:hypothetical protein
MEVAQFPVNTSSFFEETFAQIDRFSLQDKISLFKKTVLGGGGKLAAKVKCSIRSGGDQLLFSVTPSDAFFEVLGDLFSGADEKMRLKICKKLFKSIVESKSFSGTGAIDELTSGDFLFPISMGAAELSKVNFEHMDKKSLVSLKKKILGRMLGEDEKGAEKGRPVGGTLLAHCSSLCLQLSQEQAMGVLKKSLDKLTTEQLVNLDARLGGAITSMPGE